jgi:hypothetical protein
VGMWGCGNAAYLGAYTYETSRHSIVQLVVLRK